MTATLTLNRIRGHKPCRDGWEKLLKHIGKTRADDEPLPLLTVLESNGIDDALWCLRAADGIDKLAQNFASDCAGRAREAAEVARKSARGKATGKRARIARTAAKDAAENAAFAAEAATRIATYATGAAAKVGAGEAARAAAYAAEAAAWVAGAAPKDAATARDAAWDAEREWQTARFRMYLTGAV